MWSVCSEGKRIGQDTLSFIYELKTGALIEASMMIGAVLADASDRRGEKSKKKVASKVGLAFQIQDDILDVTSTDEILGKPVHSDEKNEKCTYVALYGLNKAEQEVEELTAQAMQILDETGRECSYLTWLLLELVHREK